MIINFKVAGKHHILTFLQVLENWQALAAKSVFSRCLENSKPAVNSIYIELLATSPKVFQGFGRFKT